MVYAGFGRRIVAGIIDSLFAFFLAAILLGCIALCIYLFHIDPSPLMNFLIKNPTDLTIAMIISGALFNWAYYTFFLTSRWESSPGFRAMGLEIVSSNGQRLSFLQASLWGIGSFFLGYFLYIQAFTPTKQTLYDLIAKAVVIKKTP